jgi:hypothetical protein
VRVLLNLVWMLPRTLCCELYARFANMYSNVTCLNSDEFYEASKQARKNYYFFNRRKHEVDSF